MSSDHAVLRRLRAVRSDEGGFTLVEAVVALIVLALIFTALVGVSVSALRASLYGRQNQQAADLIGQRIEELRPLSLETLANVATDMSGDSRVQSCGTQLCIDPGTGVQESLVLDPNGAVTPHVTTIQSTTTNRTAFTASTYVTVPAGQDAKYQRRVTVFVTWTNTSGLHTRSDSTIISYGTRGLPLPYFKFVPMGPTSMTVNPGARLYFGFTLINQGAPDHWNITATDSGGGTWHFVFDDNGNKAYDQSQDTTALTDTTSDGVVDTGLVQPAGNVSFWAYRDVPATASTGTTTLTVTVTSVGQPTASTANASLSDTATVTNGVISPSPTTSPTATSTPVTDCPASSVPTASGFNTTYNLIGYTLHNGVTSGATNDLPQLSMDTTAPYASSLYPYSQDLSGSAGRTVLNGGTSSSTTASQYADWRHQFSNSPNFRGTATLTFWVATGSATLNLTAYLYTLTASTNYARSVIGTAAIGPVSFSCAGFQQVAVSFLLNPKVTLSPNDFIGVRVVNNDTSSVQLAYDVNPSYYATLVLPQK